MTGSSLRIRLLAAAAISLLVALGIAGAALSVIFERNVLNRVGHELDAYLRQLANLIEVDTDERIVISDALADPRFATPLGGLYWQVALDGTIADVSPSLWDKSLPIPGSQPATRLREIQGPQGSAVIVVDRMITMQIGQASREIGLSAAIERSEIDEAVATFRREIAISLGLLAIVLMIASWLQVGVGLRPLEIVRRNLASVRRGASARLDRTVPAEVAPLVDEVNDLIGSQEALVRRARTRAADLAHGLKTPLTVMGSVVRELQSQGRSGSATLLAEQIAGMQRHVEHELARARISEARNPKRLALGPVVDRLAMVMQRLPHGSAVVWRIDVPEDCSLPMDQDDATELLGNLLENAVKWTRTTIAVSATSEPDGASIRVEDDGPGIPEDQFPVVLQRGARLDTARPGNGLGLAIVNDIAEAYSLVLTLYRAPLGGLGVRIATQQRSHTLDAQYPRPGR